MRGVPQGAVLSSLVFSISTSSIPTLPNAYTFVYVDDVAFFASATSVYSLYALLQGFLNVLGMWLYDINLKLNIKKCSLLFFLVERFVTFELYFRQECLNQVSHLKCLGVTCDEKLT